MLLLSAHNIFLCTTYALFSMSYLAAGTYEQPLSNSNGIPLLEIWLCDFLHKPMWLMGSFDFDHVSNEGFD